MSVHIALHSQVSKSNGYININTNSQLLYIPSSSPLHNAYYCFFSLVILPTVFTLPSSAKFTLLIAVTAQSLQQ